MVRRRVVAADLPPEPPKPVPVELLSLEAKTIYVTAVEQMTIADVWRHPKIRDRVPFHVVQHWAAADGWVEARRQLYTGLAKKLDAELQKRLLNQVAQDRIHQKKVMRKLITNVARKTLKAEVKSADAGARAVAELIKTDNLLNESIAGDLEDAVQVATGTPKPLEARTGHTQAEILQLSRALLAQRRSYAAEPEAETIDITPEEPNAETGPSTPPDPPELPPGEERSPLDRGGG